MIIQYAATVGELIKILSELDPATHWWGFDDESINTETTSITNEAEPVKKGDY